MFSLTVVLNTLLTAGWQPTILSLATGLKDCLCCELHIQISPQWSLNINNLVADRKILNVQLSEKIFPRLRGQQKENIVSIKKSPECG